MTIQIGSPSRIGCCNSYGIPMWLASQTIKWSYNNISCIMYVSTNGDIWFTKIIIILKRNIKIDPCDVLCFLVWTNSNEMRGHFMLIFCQEIKRCSLFDLMWRVSYQNDSNSNYLVAFLLRKPANFWIISC